MAKQRVSLRLTESSNIKAGKQAKKEKRKVSSILCEIIDNHYERK